MRVLHSALMIGDEPGVMNQMELEEKAAKLLGLKWHSRLYCPASSALLGPSLIKSSSSINENFFKKFNKVLFWLRFRLDYYKWLKAQSENYDVILLRHSKYDPFRVCFIRSSKIPVFTVHHTLEIAEILQSGGLIARLKSIAEKVFGAQGIELSKGVIGVTNEIVESELSRINNPHKPHYVYPNGIDLNSKGIPSVNDRRCYDVPEILFIASYFSPWHGLDRLLSTLANTEDNFILHIVGRVSDSDKLLASNDSRVLFHGLCSKEKIIELAEQAWVGLSSFALDRKSMKDACTLKVREYLSQGVPVYAGYNDVFPPDFIGYRKGIPDIRAILNYAVETRNLEKQEIAERAAPFISKKILVEDLSSWLCKSLSEERSGRLET